MFNKLKIEGWRQFENINIEFHNHLTVLTGANGAGKTTILNLLSQHIGWNPQFVSSYQRDKTGISHYLGGLWGNIKNFIHSFKQLNSTQFGELEVENGHIIGLAIPKNISSGAYNVEIVNNRNQKGVFIHSNRPNFSYRQIKNIPLSILSREQIFAEYKNFMEIYIKDEYRDPDRSATTLIKSTLASLALFSEGTNAVISNPEASRLLNGYNDILKIVLPPSLGFKTIKFDNPEVMFETETGDFALDAVSGGISSLINITWQLFMFAPTNENFVALIDEPENHLHPALQKSLLGNLIKAFPNVQFVIATHNPFMITSQRDSKVYVLNYDNEHRVFSQELDHVNKAATSNEILRDVLGIETSLPFWAEDELKEIINKYSHIELSRKSLSNLKDEITKLGLEDYIPSTIAKVID